MCPSGAFHKQRSNKQKCLRLACFFPFTRNLLSPLFLFFIFRNFSNGYDKAGCGPLGTPQNTTQKWSGIPGELLRLHHRLRWHPCQSVPGSGRCQCPDLALPQAWKNPALLTRGHPSEGSLMTAQDVDLGFMR